MDDDGARGVFHDPYSRLEAMIHDVGRVQESPGLQRAVLAEARGTALGSFWS